MQLTPRDLGTERYLSILRKRLTPTAPVVGVYQSGNDPAYNVNTGNVSRPESAMKVPRRLRHFWTRKLNLDEDTAQKASAILWSGTPGMGVRVAAIILGSYAAIGSIIALIAGGWFVVPVIWLMFALIVGPILASLGNTLKQADERPLTVPEIEALLPHARGRLDRTYLNLVLDTLRQDIPSTSAQSDVQAALRYLGNAIAKLPADPIASVDPLKLRAEAQAKRVQAGTEPDSVIRASLQREADALLRRAEVGEQNQAARRATALRREARAQMDALRAVLVAFSGTNQPDTATVAHLAESVSRAAAEAQASVLARQELEEGELERLLGAPLIAYTGTAPLPPVQNVQSVQNAQSPPVTPTQPTQSGQGQAGTNGQNGQNSGQGNSQNPSRGGYTGPWWRSGGQP